jgi:hypothetical protein
LEVENERYVKGIDFRIISSGFFKSANAFFGGRFTAGHNSRAGKS